MEQGILLVRARVLGARLFVSDCKSSCNTEKFRFSAEFIEVRRRALDILVNRITAHPQLRLSEDLKNFLQADEEVWVGLQYYLT